jgi:hypothetical protein
MVVCRISFRLQLFFGNIAQKLAVAAIVDQQYSWQDYSFPELCVSPGGGCVLAFCL